jgi:hypothetical protein
MSTSMVDPVLLPVRSLKLASRRPVSYMSYGFDWGITLTYLLSHTTPERNTP